MAVLLRCPDCEGKFRWEFSATSKWPDYCPLCNEYMGIDRADDDIVMPFIRSPQTKANDRVYRDLEASSEVRMHKAAEMAGCDPSEMSGLKLTDMSDRKDVEMAAIPVQSPVTQAMAQAPNLAGFQANGAAFAAGTRQGPFANAGARTVTTMSNLHQQNVQALATSGKRG